MPGGTEVNYIKPYMVPYINWTLYLEEHSNAIEIDESFKEYIDFTGLSAYEDGLDENIIRLFINELNLPEVFKHYTGDSDLWKFARDSCLTKMKKDGTWIEFYKSIAVYQTLKEADLESDYTNIKEAGVIPLLYRYQELSIGFFVQHQAEFYADNNLTIALSYQECFNNVDILAQLLKPDSCTKDNMIRDIDWTYFVTHAKPAYLKRINRFVLDGIYTDVNGKYLLSDTEMKIFLFRYPNTAEDLFGSINRFLQVLSITNPNVIGDLANIMLTKCTPDTITLDNIRVFYPSANLYNVFYSPYIGTHLINTNWKYIDQFMYIMGVTDLPAVIWNHISKETPISDEKLPEIIEHVTDQTYLFSKNQFSLETIEQVWDKITDKQFVLKHQKCITSDFLIEYYKDIPSALLSDEGFVNSTLSSCYKLIHDTMYKEADV